MKSGQILPVSGYLKNGIAVCHLQAVWPCKDVDACISEEDDDDDDELFAKNYMSDVRG